MYYNVKYKYEFDYLNSSRLNFIIYFPLSSSSNKKKSGGWYCLKHGSMVKRIKIDE